MPVHLNLEIDKDKAVFARAKDRDEQKQQRNEAIRKVLEEGKPNKEIAKRFGMSEARVSQINKREMEQENDE
jgi:DNA-binding NarL/FixJ family response regulator